jgi:glycosyltransferase 2 family protein
VTTGVNERVVSLGGERRLVSGAVVVGAVLLVFAFLLSRTDARDAWTRLRGVSTWGFAIILATYLAGFVAETASWLQTLAIVPARPRALYRFSKVLMVGNAVENVTPFACLGGEPIKALLLHRYEGIPYASALASLVITRTTDVMALILFIATGLVLMWRMEIFPSAYRGSTLVAFLLFAFAGGLFFLVQNRRVFSRLRACFGVRGAGSGPGRLLDRLRDVEDQLIAFYSREPRRLFLSVAFASNGRLT